jgi:peptide/nickel transport system substrate-binding protein
MSRYDSDSFDFEDFMRHTLSRRDAFKMGGLAAGAGALLAACSSGGSVNPNAKNGGGGGGGGNGGGGGANGVPEQAAAIPTPRKQTLIVAQGTFASYGVYNPFIPNTDYATGFGQVVKEYPFYLNLTKSTDNLINWQFTGWEYNKDFTQITFHLDPNVKFSDGKPMTSADVKFTIEMFQKHDSLSGATGNWVTEAKTIQTPDAATIVIDLTKRDTRYHYDYICSVVNAAILVVPQHIWAGKDPTTFKNPSAVFTGPYKLKEANRTLQYYLWEKVPDYWNKAKLDPKPQYVAYLTAPAADAAAEDFKNAKIDQGGADYVHAQAMIKSGYKKAIITSMEDPCLRSIHVNCDPSKGILADHRMRWVISCLMDRETYAKSIWSPATTPAIYPWPGYPYMNVYNDQSVASQFPLTYNPQKAVQLLNEIGAKKGSDGKWSYKGKKLSFSMITPVANTGAEYLIGQALAKELTKIGIPTDIKALTGAGVYNGEVAKGTYDLRSEWGPCSTSDPYQTYVSNTSKFYVPIGKQATTGDQERLKDPKLDKLTDELANADPTAASAKPIFKEALTEWYTQMPVIPSIKTIYTHQANTTYWEGWPTDDNLFMVPNNWWGQFMFVVGALKPAGS